MEGDEDAVLAERKTRFGVRWGNSGFLLRTTLLGSLTKVVATLVLGLFLSISPAMSGEIPSFTRAFFGMNDENLARACQETLMLTPEQITVLQKDWQSCWQEISLIRASNSNRQTQEITEVRKRFDQSRDEVLTAAQRDAIQQIWEIYLSAVKTVSSDFKGQLEAAFSESEKLKVVAEQNQAITATFLNELKSNLPADTFAIFQAALNKK